MEWRESLEKRSICQVLDVLARTFGERVPDWGAEVDAWARDYHAFVAELDDFRFAEYCRERPAHFGLPAVAWDAFATFDDALRALDATPPLTAKSREQIRFEWTSVRAAALQALLAAKYWQAEHCRT